MTTELPTPAASPAPALAPRPRSWLDSAWALAALTAVAAVLRLWFVLVVHPPLHFDYSDMHGYIQRAIQMSQPNFHSGPADWFFPSGTSTLISVWIRVAGHNVANGLRLAALFQILLATLEVPLLFIGARRWFSPAVSFGAAALLAVHYLALDYTGFFMSEGYLAFFLVASLALFDPERPLSLLASGLMIGMAAWMKTQALLLLPLWSLLLLRRRELWSTCLLWLGASVVVVPASVYASVHAGQPMIIASNGGQNFALGQCPINFMEFNDPRLHIGMGFGLPVVGQRAGRGWAEAMWPKASFTEPFWNSHYYMGVGWSCVRRYWKNDLRMLLLHVTDDFAGLPGAPIVPWPGGFTEFRTWCLASNYFLSLFIAPLAFVGLWLRRRDEGMWAAFGAPFLSLLATTVIFHGDPRFRVPFDAFFFVAAALTVERAVVWVQQRRARPQPAVAAPSELPRPAPEVGGGNTALP